MTTPSHLFPLALIAAAGVIAAQEPRFTARTDVVLVDVSVTDQKGRPVLDLTQDDFQVYEDGLPQRIVSFARHAPNPDASLSDAMTATGLPVTTAPAGGATKDAAKAATLGPSVLALAFDRLSPEGRALANRAALAFVERKQADELYGVFIVDQSLRVLTLYTTDKQRIGDAVARAGATATAQMAPGESPSILGSYHASADTPVVASAEAQGRSSNQLPWVDAAAEARKNGDYRTEQEIRMLLRMERSYQDMLYEMQGQASMNGLLALVDSLGVVPGKKAVIYFCEGLTIPPSVQPKFQAIIDTANRSNVTVYTIDTAGLRVQSKQAETARAVEELGGMGVGDVERHDKYLEALENNERILKLDPAVSLGILAKETGGLLIDNTNDPDRGLGRIGDDWRNYYLLGYSSTNPSLDGTFRGISVRVKRPKTVVRSRSGYVAAPMDTAGPVFSYESAALTAMRAAPPPAAFEIMAGAFSVPMPGRPGLAAVLVHVPGTSLSFRTNPKTKTYQGNVVVVARLSGEGDDDRKLSQEFRLKGAIDNIDATKGQRLLFYRTPELRPGPHRLDVAVHDAESVRSSVVTASFGIPAPTLPIVGDLIIVDHAERIEPGDAAVRNPLAVNGLQLFPAFTPAFSLAIRSELNFAAALVLEPNATAPEAELSVVADGAVVSIVPLNLGAADPSGRLLAVGRLPISALSPGRYDLRIAVGRGLGAQVRTASFTLTD